MGALVAVGFEIIIGLVFFIIFSIIALFFGNIILFDSLALAVASGFMAYGFWHIHPALSLVIGIVTLVVLYALQKTKVGFWIIGGALSLFWGFVFAFFAYAIFDKDMIWTYVVFGLGTVLMIGLHLNAKNR